MMVSVIVLGFSIALISSITFDNIINSVAEMNNDIHGYTKEEDECDIDSN